MKNLLESFIKRILVEDMEGFLADTRDLYFSEYSDEDIVKNGGKNLKRIWAKHVDRNFIQSLVKIHWFRDPTASRFQSLIQKDGKDEISATAYLFEPGSIMRSGWGRSGVILDGYVTLAANDMDVIYSGFSDNMKRDPRQTGSGMPKRAQAFKLGLGKEYILDRGTFDSEKAGHNEVLVDNWKVVGLVIPLESNGNDRKIFMKMAKVADVSGVKIYDKRMKLFALKDIVNPD